MDRELIEMDIREAIEKIIIIMESYEPQRHRDYKSRIDDSLHDMIDESVEYAIHNLADCIAYTFKVGHYKGRSDDNTE